MLLPCMRIKIMKLIMNMDTPNMMIILVLRALLILVPIFPVTFITRIGIVMTIMILT